MDKIFNFDLLYIIYFLVPFLMVVLITAFQNIKNPVYIRRFSKGFFCFEAVMFFIATLFSNGFEIYIKNIHFSVDLYGKILIYISIFTFLSFTYFSKTFIKFAKKQFYLILILLFGLLNLFIVADDIIVSFLLLFWLILTKFLISNIVQKTNSDKQKLKKQFACDFVVYFLSVALVGYDFLRHFILNEIPFCFSTISKYFAHINDFAISVAFLGFMILIFGQFGILNIFSKYNKIFAKLPIYSVSINIFVQFVAGVSLLFKVYQSFDYLFYQFQNEITLVLLFVMLYNTIISFKQNNILLNLNSIFTVNIFVGLFSVFAFSKIGSSFAFYYFVVLIVSYLPILFVFSYLEDKFNSKVIEDFKKINDKTKNIQMYLLFFLLNFAKMPISSTFLSFLILFLTINSIEYDNIFLKSMPYVFLVCMILVGICVLNLVYKILIEPTEGDTNKHFLLKHQKIVLIVFVVFLYILFFASQNFITDLKM